MTQLIPDQFSNLSPLSPPFFPNLTHQENHFENSNDNLNISDSNSNSNFDLSSLQIMILNGYNKTETTLSILNSEDEAKIVMLQEPGLNKFNFQFHHHSNWSSFLDHNHQTLDYHSRHRTGALFNKIIPPENIHPLPGGSQYLSAFKLNLFHPNCETIILLNF